MRPTVLAALVVAVLVTPALAHAQDAPPAAPPSWTVHGVVGQVFTLTFAGIAGTYSVGEVFRVGLQLQSSIMNGGGMEGCSTADCGARVIETLAVGEAHAYSNGVFDPWIGLQVGPSAYVHGDWSGGTHVGMSAQAALGFDIRPVLAKTRPVFGLSLTGGAWAKEGEFNPSILPGLWLRAGVEF